MPSGKCIDCFFFIESDLDPKKCTCEKYGKYITQNALIKISCQFYEEKNPKFFVCYQCTHKMKVGDYALVCNDQDCQEPMKILFHGIDCWRKHIEFDHVDYTAGFINKNGQLGGIFENE